MEYAQKLTSTRGGTIVLGAAAALIAGVILLVYLNRYRSTINAGEAPATVLVAKGLIEKGTPGDTIGLKKLFQPADVREADLKEGAVTDPALLRGRIAVDNIYPGQQLTAADFAPTSATAIGPKLIDRQRAISIPLDTSHGIIGHVEAGDRVDVYAGFNVTQGIGSQGQPVLKVIMQNAVVLDAPAAGGAAGGASTANVVLRADYQQAAELAWASDNGKLWIVLRPRGGAPITKPGVVTAESLLLGVKPVVVYGNVRKLVRGRP